MNKRILIIEDEPGLLLTLTDRLTAEGYEVDTSKDGLSGYEKALKNNYDLIILDIMLPKKNGFDVCRDLRNHHTQIPILMLTARGEVADKVVGLKLGADDYLTKPFEMIELLARVEALLRRRFELSSVDSGQGTFEFGDVKINFQAAEVYKNNILLDLSAQEFRLLCFLIENRGTTLSRDILLNRVWEYQSMPTTRTVDVHIAWLRQKLEANPKHPKHILTVHKLGYKFIE